MKWPFLLHIPCKSSTLKHIHYPLFQILGPPLVDNLHVMSPLPVDRVVSVLHMYIS